MTRSGKAIVGALILMVALALCGCGVKSSDGEYAERMATEHAGDRPVPGAAAVDQEADVVTETVSYATVNGKPVRGYLAAPAGAEPGGPGILVIQEWWGLNDNIRTMARRLAGAGYQALAVDLYEGEVAETAERARELMSQAMSRETALEDNLRQAHGYLAEQRGASKIGTIGWCFGGGWSLRAALMLGEKMDAAVIYYGRLVTDPQALASLQVPVLGIFGSEDHGIPVESVREFERVLNELGKTAEIHVYEGANHAFANPSGTRYDPEAAEDAWSKTIAFLSVNLSRLPSPRHTRSGS